MARTSSKPKALTYAISYGFVGGPLHARHFRRHMKAAGLSPAPPENAAIIIAHSGGCWLIPETAKPRLVVYIGMPLAQSNPRQTLLQSKRSSLRRSRPVSNFKTQLKNTYYTLKQPKRNLGLIKMARYARPVIFPDADAVFVANRHDPWPNAEALDKYVAGYDWSFIGVEGAHDDIWDHPERYVEVIKHYAGLLA